MKLDINDATQCARIGAQRVPRADVYVAGRRIKTVIVAGATVYIILTGSVLPVVYNSFILEVDQS